LSVKDDCQITDLGVTEVSSAQVGESCDYSWSRYSLYHIGHCRCIMQQYRPYQCPWYFNSILSAALCWQQFFQRPMGYGDPSSFRWIVPMCLFTISANQ
jgi:hypothetical protein